MKKQRGLPQCGKIKPEKSRILSIFLCICMVFTLMPMMNVYAAADVAETFEEWDFVDADNASPVYEDAAKGWRFESRNNGANAGASATTLCGSSGYEAFSLNGDVDDFRIKTISGDAFNFKEFVISSISATTRSFDVIGYRDGVKVTQKVSVNYTTQNYVTIQVGTDLNFQNVDEVRLIGTGGDKIDIYLEGFTYNPVPTPAETTPTTTFSFDGENANKLTGTTVQMQYSLDGGGTWANCSDGNTDLSSVTASITEGNDIKVKYLGNGTTTDSDIQTIDITKAAAPTAGKTDCTTTDNNDGKLTGVTAAMEYKLSTAGSWTAGTGSDITGLANGTYYVRVKATGTVLTSAEQSLAISAYASPAKAITAFNFNGLTPNVIGTINEGAKTIALTVPNGTDVTALVPSIAHSGVSVSPNTGVPQDFTNPIVYSVTAANASTQPYTVTVTEAAAAPVAKIGATEYTSLQAAFDANTGSQTIELLSDITLTSPVTGSKAVILDLKGKTIDGVTDTAIRFSHPSYGKLTITGGGIITSANRYTIELENATFGNLAIVNSEVKNTSTGTDSPAIYNGGHGAVTISGESKVSADRSPAIFNNNDGGLTVSDNAVITSACSSYGTIRVNHANSADTSLVITGGRVENTNADGKAIYNQNISKISVSGGEISGYIGIENWNTGTINVSGGRVSATGAAIDNNSTGRINISGDAVITSTEPSTSNGTICLQGGTSSDTVLQITGGTIENTSASNGIAINNKAAGIVTISGGAITPEGRMMPLTQLTTYASVSSATAVLSAGKADYILSQTPAPIPNRWLVYSGTSGETLATDVTATISGSTLSLSGSGLTAGTYRVAAYDRASGKGASTTRLQLTVTDTVGLTADTTSNSVDNDLEITFAEAAAFRGAITAVSYNGNTLTASQYDKTQAGKVILKPSVTDNTYLRTPGTANVVISATGYGNSTVSQTILAGAVDSLEVTTQPVAGAASGDAFATQPVVKLKDQYGNYCTTGVSATANVVATAKSGTGSWSIGGTATKAATAGTATFTDLTCTLTTVGNGSTTFTSGIKTVDSSTFSIPQNAGKSLIADTTSNSVDNDLEITFAEDTAFRTAITAVVYNGNTLTASQYDKTQNGKVILKPSMAGNTYLRTPGTGNVVITATGYGNSTVSQTILTGAVDHMLVLQDIVSPASNGGQFANQPIIALTDRYNNTITTDNTTIITVSKKDGGSWTLTGTTTGTAINGVVSFSNLGATNSATVSNSQLAFNTAGLGEILSAQVTLPGQTSNGGGGGGGSSTPTIVTKIESGESVAGTNVDKLVAEKKSLTVEGKTGEKLVFDTEALKTIVGQTKDSIKVEIKDVSADHKSEQPGRLVVSLTITAGGKHISSFGNGIATVSLPYELKAGEKAQDVTVWYLAEDGKMTEVPCTYDPVTKLATFKVNHFSLYVVGTADTSKWVNPYSDVKESSWYYDAVRYVSANEMMQGTEATIFNPRAKTTRGMIVTILWRMENEPKAAKEITFTDVKNGKYYHDAVAWASEKGIVGGYSAERFAPEDNITREQLAVILHNYAASKGYSMVVSGTPSGDESGDLPANLSAFSDAGSIHKWGKDAMSWANAEGLINGTGSNLLDPLGAAERCQVAAILQRFMENTVK